MLDEIVLELLPPEEKEECGHTFDATCEICFFLKAECWNLKELLKICDSGYKGYFKVKEDKNGTITPNR